MPWFYGYTKVKRQFFRSPIFPCAAIRVPHPAGLSNTPGGSGVYVFQRKIETQFKELHGLQLEGQSERALIPRRDPADKLDR